MSEKRPSALRLVGISCKASSRDGAARATEVLKLSDLSEIIYSVKSRT